MDLLLDPVCSYLQHISTVGLTIKTPLGEEVYRAKLVLGVFDLPAKAAVLCAKQYNGEYGCSVCLHPGKRLANNARVYLPGVYSQRTHEQVIAYGIEAQREHSCVKGVVGISPLASTLDLVASIPIDYMHNVLEGVTRWLTRAWFESKNHAKCFYIGRHVRKIDALLLEVCPPTNLAALHGPSTNILSIGRLLSCTTGCFITLCLFLWNFCLPFTGITMLCWCVQCIFC